MYKNDKSSSKTWYGFSIIFFKIENMKTSSKITLGAAALAFTGIMLFSKKKVNTQKTIASIANEGYETAADNLKIGKKLKKMHFGPVLPHHNFS